MAVTFFDFVQILNLITAIASIFGILFVLLVMIRSKLIRISDNSFLLVGVLAGDFLTCASNFWQFLLGFIDLPTNEPFLTKGQCLLMEAPGIAGMVISQTATLSLAVDRMNSLRNTLAYFQKNHFKSALYWWGAEAILGVATAVMPQLWNDIGSIIHFYYPTWPDWFRLYWMVFSIIVSALVLLAYLLVIVYSRMKKAPLMGNSSGHERSIAREKQITKTVMRVLSVYVLFWGVPSILYNVTVKFNVDLGSKFGLAMMIGSGFCSVANVFFLLMREDVQGGVRSLFGCNDERSLQFVHTTTGQNGTMHTSRVAPLSTRQ